VKVYSTCPQSKDVDRLEYARAVADVACWSEAAGCTGILVYTDNSILDPWLVSQLVMQNTAVLRPLVAVQPIYMHPYTAAKMVASLAYLYGRPVDLNMLAGGFRNDLIALGDQTPHDERYARTSEYTRIMMGLIRDEGPVTLHGRYYDVENLRLAPSVPPDLAPDVLVSGSSPAGRAMARQLGATPVMYPERPGEEKPIQDGAAETFGVRVGVIARDTDDEAWRVAHERFPTDRQGQITHRLAMHISDSHWHRQLSAGREHGAPDSDAPDPYWLGPFQNYKTFCPYVVGSYDRVARVLEHYAALGAHTFVLDIPPSEEELTHTGIAFQRVQARITA
jgi:alkanesulfonate monooxygenase